MFSPALAAAGGKPLADQSHELSRKRGGFVAKPLSPLAGGERFGIDQLERAADSNQSGPCHVEIARRGNQARMTEEALDQGEFHPTLN